MTGLNINIEHPTVLSNLTSSIKNELLIELNYFIVTLNHLIIE